jgi:hypothetical protein
MAKGATALLSGQWSLARTGLDEAEHIFRNRCTGVTWERDTIHNFSLWALLQLGDITELSRRWTALYRESRDRGDRYAASILSTFYITMIKLARNEQLESEADLDAAVRHGDGRMFNLQNSAALEALVHYHLYRSNVTHAWARVTTIWPEYARSMLLRVQLIKIHMLELRARTALAMAERVTQSAVYIRQAKADARQLESEGQKCAVAHAHYVRAGIAACAEDPVAAIEALNRAATAYDAAEMPLRASILRYRLGEIQNDEETRTRREDAEKWIKAQGIVSPTRWAGMYAPGLAKISNESIETSY